MVVMMMMLTMTTTMMTCRAVYTDLGTLCVCSEFKLEKLRPLSL